MEDEDYSYGIRSVYYNKDKSSIIGYSEHPTPPHGASPELLKEDLLMMMAAFNKEVLYVKDYEENKESYH